jgi:Tol biopolymer transport system component
VSQPADSRRSVLANPRIAWTVASALLAGVGALSVTLFLPRTAPAVSTIRFDVFRPGSSGGPNLQFALSPDGSHLVAAAERALWLRPLDQTEGRILAGTKDGSFPFWSADSKYVAFAEAGKLLRTDLAGTPPQMIAELMKGGDGPATGGAWNQDDVIIFARQRGPLFQVRASGGTPTKVTELDRSREETAHRQPVFLPDGRSFLYLAVSTKPELSAIYVASLDSGERKRLVASNVKAAYAAPGFLLFVREHSEGGTGTLMAQRFDPSRLQLDGEPLPIADNIGVNNNNSLAGFTVSQNGILAHRQPQNVERLLSQLTWFDRSRKPLGVLSEPGFYRNPRLSPDGTHVVVETRSSDRRDFDLALIDARGVSTRFTFDASDETSAVWSPNGSQIAWKASQPGGGGGSELFRKASTGVGREEKIPLQRGPWVAGAVVKPVERLIDDRPERAS